MCDKVDQYSMLENNESKTYSYLMSILPSISIIFFILSIIYSLLLLSKNSMPTLSVLVFSISLFSLLGVIYLLLEHKINYCQLKNLVATEKQEIHKVLQIIFITSVTIIFIILQNINYVKPSIYYVFIGIASVSIALQIAFKSKVSNKDILNILVFQILVLAIIIRASSLYLSPFHIGIDTHQFHYPHISRIIENGYLNTAASHYYHYPFSHLIQAISGLLIGFSISHFKLINLCHSIVLIPIGYLIGTYLLDKKAGLMCSLLFSLSTMNIFITLFSTSKIGGTSLLLLSFYLLLKQIELLNIRYLLVFFLSTIGLFFWHPEISASLFFILSSYFLTKTYMSKSLRGYSLFLSYTIFYISYNMYVSKSLFNRIIESLFFINIDQVPTLIQNVAGNLISMDFILQLFVSYLGITMPFFLASYFILLKLKRLNPNNLFLILSLLFVCLLPVVGVFSNNFGLNPTRLLTYISLISLIVTSCSIFIVFNFKSRINIIAFVLVFFIFSIFSVSSYITADGNELYNDKIPVVVIYTTQASVAATTFIDLHSPASSIIYTDTATSGVSDSQKIFSCDSHLADYMLVNTHNLKRQNIAPEDLINLSAKNINQIYSNKFAYIEVLPV